MKCVYIIVFVSSRRFRAAARAPQEAGNPELLMVLAKVVDKRLDTSK